MRAREAGYRFQCLLTRFLGNYPPVAGALDRLCSSMTEEKLLALKKPSGYSAVRYFVCPPGTVLSVLEVEVVDARRMFVIIRDALGKYAWEIKNHIRPPKPSAAALAAAAAFAQAASVPQGGPKSSSFGGALAPPSPAAAALAAAAAASSDAPAQLDAEGSPMAFPPPEDEATLIKRSSRSISVAFDRRALSANVRKAASRDSEETLVRMLRASASCRDSISADGAGTAAGHGGASRPVSMLPYQTLVGAAANQVQAAIASATLAAKYLELVQVQDERERAISAGSQDGLKPASLLPACRDLGGSGDSSSGDRSDSTGSFPDAVLLRQFLVSLGVWPTGTVEPQFHPVAAGLKLDRSIKALDRIYERDSHKLGVVYVGPNQIHQNVILSNSAGSPLYDAFVRGLGWEVNLETHEGYLGGLSQNGAFGKTSRYFADFETEVMFHVITLMPTDPEDPQQVQKKKHVGNNLVNIIWSEHNREYQPNTISSQFNHVTIVVYPLDTSMLRVRIHCKHDKRHIMPVFGPLLDGMVVPAAHIARLVRETAVNADRIAKAAFMHAKPPSELRANIISEIAARYQLPAASTASLAADLILN